MKQPNFLFLFPDQHRGDWLPYDQSIFQLLKMDKLPIRMPNLKYLMDRGVTFTKAVTPCPLCAPARACLASGKRYDKCGVIGNEEDYPTEQKTFYSVLKENGYNVGGVGKFDLHKNTQWWGLEGWIEELGILGFTTAIDNAGKIDAIVSGNEVPKDPYMNFLYQKGLAEIHIQDMKNRAHRTHATPLPDEAYCDNWLSQNGIDMIRNFPMNKPWFLMVNFTGPHGPFDITESMKNRWENVDFPLPVHSDQEIEKSLSLRQNYAAMLENIDRNIGLLIHAVEQRGELDNTVIIYSSDHGEMLGDFNAYGKCKPERGSVHIPCVISGPGVQSGVYSDALIELQDLAQTILDLAELTMEEAVDSISLKPILQGKQKDHRRYQISQLARNKHTPANWKMISDGVYKLILKEQSELRLYQITEDPWELHNLAENNPEIVLNLFNQLNPMF